MARPSSSSAAGRTSAGGRGQGPEMRDDLRRRDPPDIADLAQSMDDEPIGATSPPPDGGLQDHPVHDQDFDDIETEQYESLIGDVEDAAVAQAKEGTHHVGEDTGEALLPLDPPLTEEELAEDENEEELIKKDESAGDRA